MRYTDFSNLGAKGVTMTDTTTNLSYLLLRPSELTTSVIFASPHSGRKYSAAFLRKIVLDEMQVRSSEDAFVDDLFGSAVDHGAPLLLAQSPRAYLDLNRGVNELDPAVINGVRSVIQNPRIASGLGVIPRVVSNGRAIYSGKLSLPEAHERISSIWRPYHDTLQSLMDEAHEGFGEAILVDCHSMPHEALDYVTPSGAERPDVVLGDRFGAAAASSVVERIELAFTSAGFKVARNMPFAGAYICQHYGRPSRRHHAVQIEIDRSIYMDESKIKPNSNFQAFKSILDGVIAEIANIGRPVDLRVAAE
jgi:N-formylglutamate amidohydrolase